MCTDYIYMVNTFISCFFIFLWCSSCMLSHTPSISSKSTGISLCPSDWSAFICFTLFSNPDFAPEEYHVNEGHSAKGFYSMHLNAFYNLQKHTYSDAIIQPVHHKDEFSAFCEMVDRHQLIDGLKDVFIGDRGYCSYNNMAHVLEKGQYFLFRTKDIHSKGLVKNFDFPSEDSFDIRVNVTLVRSHKKKIVIKDGFYRRYVDANATFDYLTYGSTDTYDLSFRIIRFPISKDTFECIVTNLPEDEFPMEQI